MFELQDSKGNRFELSRTGNPHAHTQLVGSGNATLVKRLLRYCSNSQIIRAYRCFFGANTRLHLQLSKPIAAQLTPKSTSLVVIGREQQLFNAIAHGQIRIKQTHKVIELDLATAEQQLGLLRPQLRTDLSAIATQTALLQNQQNAAKELPWGVRSLANGSPIGPLLEPHFQRF